MYISAYNLIPGAVILPDDDTTPIVISSVRRDPDTERIGLLGRTGLGVLWGHDFTYNDQLNLVGLSVDSDDWGNADYGTTFNWSRTPVHCDAMWLDDDHTVLHCDSMVGSVTHVERHRLASINNWPVVTEVVESDGGRTLTIYVAR